MLSPMPDAFVVDAVRSPIGRRGGSLSGIRAEELAAQVMNGLVDRLDVDRVAGEDQIECAAAADRPQQTLRAPGPRDQPAVDLGLAEAGRVGGVAEVAGQRELAPASEREPVDRRDDRLRRRLEPAEAEPEGRRP